MRVSYWFYKGLWFRVKGSIKLVLERFQKRFNKVSHREDLPGTFLLPQLTGTSKNTPKIAYIV